MPIASRLAVLALLLAARPGLAAPAGAPAAAGPSAPAAPASPAATPTPGASTSRNEAKSKSGLVLSADLREDYVAGFPLLVTITVRNDTAAPLSFPDLAARPWLVRFFVKNEKYTWERYTTPPAADPGTAWTIAPRAQRQVTLEIPSTANLDPGAWQLGLVVKDPAGDLTLPGRPVRVAAAKVAGGAYAFEPTIQQSTGAMIPWVQEAASGFDLYLLQLAPKGSTRAVGLFHLARLAGRADPVLSRARPTDAGSRYLYWMAGPNSLTLARLEGTTLRGRTRTIGVPYPAFELLGRGVTDAKGGVVVPIWVPNPAGTSGTVYALCVDDRGGQVLRQVTPLPARPATVATGIDAASNLLLALGHAGAVDLYRVDPTLPPELGARGTRVTALADGWAAGALAFDTLPEQGDRPGGLALLSVLTNRSSAAPTYRSVWSDLSGRTLQESTPLPWAAPGAIGSLLPAGYGPFHYTTTDPSGAVWYGVQGGAPQKVPGARPGVLWMSADTVSSRRLADGTVFEDRALGPVGQ